jgi:hypothetical protein
MDNYFLDKYGAPEEEEKQLAPNYFREKYPEEKPEKRTAQSLMTNRPKAAYDILKAMPESAAGMFKQALRFAADPKSTIQAGGELAEQTGNKLGRTAAEVVHGQEMEVMPERQEQLPDAAWEAMKERLGGGDELATTLTTDPLGLALDASVLKPLRGLDPMSGLSRLTDKAVTAGSKAAYADALGIPKWIDPERRTALINKGMDSKLDASPKGLQRLAKDKGVQETIINDILENMGKNDRFDVNDINQHMNKLMREFEGTPDGNKKIAKIKQMRDNMNREFIYRDTNGNPILGQNGMPIQKDLISAKEMQHYKTKAYEDAYARESTSPQKAISAKTKGTRTQGRGAKDSLNRTYPELIDPNLEWGKLAQLKPMIERAMEKFTEVGHADIIPYISKKVRDPEWRSKIAIATRRMADGDIELKGMELGSADLRIALVMSGRNEEFVNEGFSYQ